MRKQSTKFASWNISTLRSLSVLLGSLCSNEDDEYENDTSKVTSRSSKFIVIIPTCSIRQMLAFFFWSWILKDCIEVQKKKKKVHVLHNKWNFTSLSCSDGKAMYKKAWCTCRFFFFLGQSKPVPFLKFSLTSPSSLLRSLSTLTVSKEWK